LALLGCGVAIIVSATIMSLSYYLGPASRHRQDSPQKLPHVERLKQQAETTRDAGRRAA
jgi:hypothetical protein